MNVEIRTETPIFLFLGIFGSKFLCFVFAVHARNELMHMVRVHIST
jgi:hypothetical protein